MLTHALKNVFVTNSHLLLCVLLVALERKISMRQSREELIKRGVLKEIYDKGKGDRSAPWALESRAWNGCAYFSELDSVFCIALSGFEPWKLHGQFWREENFADHARALSIIEKSGSFILSIGITPQGTVRNDTAAGTVWVLVGICGFSNTHSWGEVKCRGSFGQWGFPRHMLKIYGHLEFSWQIFFLAAFCLPTVKEGNAGAPGWYSG